MLDMRTFRGPNGPDTSPTAGADTAFLGDEQVRWLVTGLERSRATWKVVAADMPLGLVVRDGPTAIEAVAQGDPDGPLGRELEIAALLSQLRGIPNIVWVTADVHYCAAHHYDPANARFTDFDPFWEFVAGPVHAGTFGPNALDETFGPAVVFEQAATYPNMDPSQGFQFFGHATITDGGRRMTVSLIDVGGTVLFTTDIDAM
jgi:alkaline phosphatase D